MYLFADVIFYSGQRKNLPGEGYRPDAIFNESGEYWGMTFTALPVEKFDDWTPGEIQFSFQECHYQEILPGQSFSIMEGPYQVGEGKVISIEKGE